MNDLFGYITKAGTVAVEPQYDMAEDFSEGLAVVRKAGKYGAIDKQGNWVVPLKYDKMDLHFLGGHIPVNLNGKWGIVNLKGVEVIPPDKYEWCGAYSEGLFPVQFNGKRGFVNAKGEIKIPFQYEAVNKFSEGYAWARHDSTWQLLKRPK
jgi:WG containing repeat